MIDALQIEKGPETGKPRIPIRMVLALIDQAAVSGTNFLTTLIVARASSPRNLGLYTLGFTIVVLCLAIQDALVTTPFTILDPRRPAEDSPVYAAAVFVHHLLLSACTMFGLGISALVLILVGNPFGVSLGVVLVSVAAMLPLLLLREFARRFAFGRLDLKTACAIDVLAGGLQVAGLLLLAWTSTLTPTTVFLVSGFACAVAGLGWWAFRGSTFRFEQLQLREVWLANWDLGQWVLGTQLIGVVHGYSIHWLLAIWLGPAIAGIFAACLTVVLLTNPLMLSTGNLLAPRAARAYHKDGSRGLWQVLLQTSALVGGMMSLFALGTFFEGERVLELFYGNAYAGHGRTVFVLALAILIGSLGMVAEHGLRACGHARTSFFAGTLGLASTVLLALALTAPLGLMGASLGYLLGSVVSTLYRGRVLWNALHSRKETATDEQNEIPAEDSCTSVVASIALPVDASPPFPPGRARKGAPLLSSLAQKGPA